jgi:heme-degrading monooxygenase HmoA
VARGELRWLGELPLVTPELVTVHIWTLPAARIPWAIGHVATDRGRVRRAHGASFAKLLGTTHPGRFQPKDTNLTRWALLTCWATPGDATRWATSPVARRWNDAASETCVLELEPLSSRGRWSRREPFGRPARNDTGERVAVLTRARLRPRTAATFWRAIPPVASELATQSGLRLSLGVGEAPVGWQGTFSVWDSAAAVRHFAYSSPEHLQAIEHTTTVGWYAEELFARFAVLASSGTVDGIDPLS